MKIVIGHKNPDTDSIVSALVLAKILGYKACASGEPNEETKYLLDLANIKPPQVIEKFNGEEVYLVDTNNKEELPEGEFTLIGIVDHHRLFGNLSSSNPIEVIIKPVGSTATIIAERYFEKLDEKDALLLLGAILSDTVVFKSPTTTDLDIQIAKKLAKICGIENIEEFGIKLKKAGSKLSDNIRENLLRDCKTWDLPRGKVMCAQLEIFDYEDVLSKKEEYLKEMESLKNENGCKAFLLMVTNVLDGDTKLLVVCDDDVKELIEKALGKIENNEIFLPGVMSRKKQIQPKITEVFS
jgi:manganese-dependent inorganic pyrophosphatase